MRSQLFCICVYVFDNWMVSNKSVETVIGVELDPIDFACGHFRSSPKGDKHSKHVYRFIIYLLGTPRLHQYKCQQHFACELSVGYDIFRPARIAVNTSVVLYSPIWPNPNIFRKTTWDNLKLFLCFKLFKITTQFPHSLTSDNCNMSVKNALFVMEIMCDVLSELQIVIIG